MGIPASGEAPARLPARATDRGAGPGLGLRALRDTYPELGWGGYHLQPAEAVAAALERSDGLEGGVLCVCEASSAITLAGRLEEAGFELRHWDNGSSDRYEER